MRHDVHVVGQRIVQRQREDDLAWIKDARRVFGHQGNADVFQRIPEWQPPGAPLAAQPGEKRMIIMGGIAKRKAGGTRERRREKPDDKRTDGASRKKMVSLRQLGARVSRNPNAIDRRANSNTHRVGELNRSGAGIKMEDRGGCRDAPIPADQTAALAAARIRCRASTRVSSSLGRQTREISRQSRRLPPCRPIIGRCESTGGKPRRGGFRRRPFGCQRSAMHQIDQDAGQRGVAGLPV